MRVNMVAWRMFNFAIGFIAVIVMALAALLRQAAGAAQPIIMIPIHLPLCATGEVVHGNNPVQLTTIEILILRIPDVVLRHRV